MNLYSLLPDTMDTRHAKEQSQSQSQVLLMLTGQRWLMLHEAWRLDVSVLFASAQIPGDQKEEGGSGLVPPAGRDAGDAAR